MKSLSGILRLLRRHKTNVVLHILSNILMAVFTVLTIPATIPVFKLFFDPDSDRIPKPTDPLWFNNVDQYAKYELSEIIQSSVSKSDALLTICLIIVCLYFLKNLFTYLALFFMAPVRTGIVQDLREEIFVKLTKLPLTYFTEERKGDLISRATADVQEVEWSILNVLEKAVKEPMLILGCLAFMLYTSPKLTLFVFVLMIATAGVIGGISNRLKRQSVLVQSTLGRLVSVLDETLFGIKVIKGFQAENEVKEGFDSINITYRNLHKKLLWRRDLASPLSEFLGIAVVCILFWFGGMLVFGGELSAPVFMAFLLAFFYIINPLKSFSKAYYSIQKGLAAVDRINMILDEDEKITDPPDPEQLDAFRHSIKFEKVHFAYPGQAVNALSDIDLEIRKGDIIALVGSSGAGKTTMADLLPRFYDVSSGSIKIDGLDIRKLLISELRSKISIVTQEAVLFNDTIAANITFGSKSASQQQIEQAARIANAHDFIVETSQGYQTVIGDRGTKLSGGQKQRISIARAILQNPPILILDEATSALDSESERLVQDALQKVMQDRTSIVIAHRLSTIQNADKIIVMKEGRIVETGNHVSLMKLDGEYAKFVELQVF